jgi:competence protein ComEC
VEEVNYRARGARLLIRLAHIDGLPDQLQPYRLRLSTLYPPAVHAGDYVSFKARMMPPSHPSLPDGYDFARDAWFFGLGGVGNILGRSLSVEPAPYDMNVSFRFFAALDRLRNQLALRVVDVIGGPAGAIGAAMVTGKRDFLDNETSEIIRQAGIFHIITIAGVQMSLVASLFFFGFRRVLALSRTLALHYPIKKWAAGLAIIASVFYDLATGSRIGTERALIMVVIILGAVMLDRAAFSLRNLALAMWVIVLIEPMGVMGASFQLSFAAVAALMAVYEIMQSVKRRRSQPEDSNSASEDMSWLARLGSWLLRGPCLLLLSTCGASLATMSFMTYNFHEISAYVMIGNPLTLTIIEFFCCARGFAGQLSLSVWA